MELGALLPERTIDGVLEGIARLGLGVTGVSAEAIRALETSAGPGAVAARLRHANITLAQVGCYTNLEGEPGPARRRMLSRLEDAIHLAGAAGARCVVSGTGHMDPARKEEVFAAHPDNWSDRAMGRLADGCAEAAYAAAQAGTCFCVEPWVITTLDTPRRIGELVRRVGTDGFGILLDPVNLMTLSTYFDNAQLIEECFQQAGDAIFLVHAKDTLLLESSFTYHMSEAPPGDGILDYGMLLRCMSQLSDAGTPLLIEHLSDYPRIEKARDYVRHICEREGVAV